jgi:regulator of replication initiation timing
MSQEITALKRSISDMKDEIAGLKHELNVLRARLAEDMKRVVDQVTKNG